MSVCTVVYMFVRLFVDEPLPTFVAYYLATKPQNLNIIGGGTIARVTDCMSHTGQFHAVHVSV